MPVTTTHPEYDEFLTLWRETRDAVKGDRAIRKNTYYLPAPFINSEPKRYAQYKARAYFLGITGRTENAMIGMVFRKPAKREVPPVMEPLLNNFDGAGNSIEQVAKDAMAGLLETRRHLFLVDYPSAGEGMDAETESMLGLRPVVAQYAAEALINWRFAVVGGTAFLGCG